MTISIKFSMQLGHWQFAGSLEKKKFQDFSAPVSEHKLLPKAVAAPVATPPSTSAHPKPKPLLSECVVDKCNGSSISASTAGNCHTAVKVFRKYCGDKDIDMNLITQDLVKGFEKWMCHHNLKPTTRACYMASLRSVYNRAVKHHKLKDNHPFLDAHTGHVKTEKRSIEADMVKKIGKLKLKVGTRLCLARDMFLFSIYAQGMAFADMANMNYSHIKDGKIEYYRQKTGNRVCVELNSEMLRIMKRYYQKNNDHLFPIITSEDPAVAYRQYCSALNYHNRLLKKIGKMVKLNVPLTSYVSRHTWASLSYALHIPLAVISQGMGHSSTDITNVYIRGLNDNSVSEANEKVLNEVSVTPIGNRCNTDSRPVPYNDANLHFYSKIRKFFYK
jgi:integrase/recombinase XerD